MSVFCRSCHGDLGPVFSLGNQYLSDFRTDKVMPPRYYLAVDRCSACGLVQLHHSTPSHLMYHERYGFKSGVNATGKADLREIVHEAFAASRRPVTRWLDIACNDGTLLSNIPAEGVYRVGVDPIAKLTAEAEAHADRVITDFFRRGQFTGEKPFDVITSISMFYDLDDPNEFVSGVADILAHGGVWVIQQNYLGATVRLNAVDNFCHEHLTYFTLGSLEPLLRRHGLMVFSVSENTVNGGSFRTFVAHEGTRIEDLSVQKLRDRESREGLHTIGVYQKFWERSQQRLSALHDLVEGLSKDAEVMIYGASTRGGTIWQAAGLTNSHISFAVDRNPDKVGKVIASIQVPIISEEEMRADPPGWMIVSPWFFADEFRIRESAYLKNGGHFIYPLPNVTIE